jgi:hypothetical protein
MLELNTNFEEEQRGQNLNETGVYDVTLVRVGVKNNKSGSKSLILTLDGGGKYPITFYNGVYQKADGSAGFDFGRILNPLAFLCGVKNITEGKAQIETKNGTQTVDIIEGFGGQKLKVAVQSKWNDYTSNYKPEVVAVFDANGRSAKEILAGVQEPKQIQKFLSSDFTDVGPKGGTPKKPVTVSTDFSEDFDSDF